jgi:hypothetical protein
MGVNHSLILLFDAAINLLLGIALISFPRFIVKVFGLPPASPKFYANILGGVLFGVGIALIIEYARKPGGMSGLGLGGAVAINICGGIVLILWLLFGDLTLSPLGSITLWMLGILLVILSLLEVLVYKRRG